MVVLLCNTPDSPQVAEKQREEEEYRQIRMKMRAEQMLADSALPHNMRRHALHYTGYYLTLYRLLPHHQLLYWDLGVPLYRASFQIQIDHDLWS